MSRSKEHDRRLRVARSLGTSESIKNNPHLEHAEAENSRRVNEEVINGTYIRRESGRTRFAPVPQRMHFSPTQQLTLRGPVSYEEAHQL